LEMLYQKCVLKKRLTFVGRATGGEYHFKII